jgi:NAD(P)H-dependent flavin oxidoreductase YrpB (nitropropane dioxygenase family)
MPWNDTPLARAPGIRLPVIQAPMAGGLSTPRLAAARTRAAWGRSPGRSCRRTLARSVPATDLVAALAAETGAALARLT